ncbi:PstA family ABC transporter permease [Wukongibacter sp. M2B1]|uniref:PstA family ABC transporter permease n=1 Tax=Wukongibacter sp. M2B1 TaxID=3088895 RepID=UPI003D7B10B3
MKKHFLIKLWSIASGLIVLSIVTFFIHFIVTNGIDALSYEFITQKPKGTPLGTEGGIFPAIMGSIYFTLIAVAFASIMAFSTSIYLVFYCKGKRTKGLVRFVIGTIAGIPSIVLGLFGYSFFVVYLDFGISILTGGIVLGIMIFPYIEVRFEKSFLEVNRSMIEASYSLGISRLYTIFKIVLPICIKDLISAVSLASSFAIGATAPILFTGGVLYASVPKDILSPAMALPLHLYMLIGEGISFKNAYGTSLVLLIVLLLMNSFSLILSIRKEDD